MRRRGFLRSMAAARSGARFAEAADEGLGAVGFEFAGEAVA